MNKKLEQTSCLELITSYEIQQIIESNAIQIDCEQVETLLPIIPTIVVDNIQWLIRAIIELVPAGARITISKNLQRHLGINIINSGIDLSRYKDLVAQLTVPADMCPYPEQNGTLFTIHLYPPDFEFDHNERHTASIAHYYAEIRKQMSEHWGNKHAFKIQLEQILQDYYPDDTFDLDQWSRLMMLSQSQLFRKVKEATGISPGRYLLKYRLHKAKIKLKSTDHNISEIVRSCGFKSNSHFTRSFKKQYHSNPTEYRDRNQ